MYIVIKCDEKWLYELKDGKQKHAALASLLRDEFGEDLKIKRRKNLVMLTLDIDLDDFIKRLDERFKVEFNEEPKKVYAVDGKLTAKGAYIKGAFKDKKKELDELFEELIESGNIDDLDYETIEGKEKLDKIFSDFMSSLEEEVLGDKEGQQKAEEKITKYDHKRTALEKIVKRSKSLVGGKNFVSLLEELSLVAPRLYDRGLSDIFKSQAYLFAINDGNGLEEYLDVLSQFFYETGIYDAKKIESSVIKLEYKKDFEPASAVPSSYLFVGNLSFYCFDISEWLNYMNTQLFVDFLNAVASLMVKAPVAFRIPFVEAEIAEDVKKRINDILFVKLVNFVPYTNEELRKLAQNEAEDMGFTVHESAWKYFDRRITEEKSDGRFYGKRTVKKIVDELVYKKTLNCEDWENAEVFDRVIGEKDTMRVCRSLEEDFLTGEEMLDNLVGMDYVKEKIKEIIAQIELSRKTETLGAPCIHMKFVGKPGTGKTTVARIIGKILSERGVLRVGNFFEYSGRDFVGRYIGETAPKTAGMCRAAYGSVLFIDEAYSLYRSDDNGRDFGREALDTLIAEMENHRSDLLVIMAGYEDEMNLLMEGNTGLESRIPYTIEFENFDRDMLYEIFEKLVKKHFEYTDSLLEEAKSYFENLSDKFLEDKTFSNGRFVRNLFERTWAKAAVRYQYEDDSEIVLSKEDFLMAINDNEFELSKKKKRAIGFGVK